MGITAKSVKRFQKKNVPTKMYQNTIMCQRKSVAIILSQNVTKFLNNTAKRSHTRSVRMSIITSPVRRPTENVKKSTNITWKNTRPNTKSHAKNTKYQNVKQLTKKNANEKKEHCETSYKKECSYEKKKECHTEYRTETTYEKKQECHTTYREECKPDYHY